MLFRVEANSTIGRGHLSRLTAVAQMLQEQYETLFLIAEVNRDFCEPILGGWQVRYLKEEKELLQILSTKDILWVDGYTFDNEWRLRFRPFVKSLIDINDLPADIRGADVVLNHCPGILPEMFPENPGQTILPGLEYVLLRPAFLDFARSLKHVKLTGEGVFVCFGGADPLGLGESFVKQLIERGFKEPVYFVTGKGKSEFGPKAPSNLHILQRLNEGEMIYYMRLARLLVIPSSTLSLEAIALRKPMITLYYVNNQKLIYQGLIKHNLAIGGGRVDSVKQIHEVVNLLFQTLPEEEKLKAVVYNQIQCLDGNSAERLGAFMVKDEL